MEDCNCLQHNTKQHAHTNVAPVLWASLYYFHNNNKNTTYDNNKIVDANKDIILRMTLKHSILSNYYIFLFLLLLNYFIYCLHFTLETCFLTLILFTTWNITIDWPLVLIAFMNKMVKNYLISPDIFECNFDTVTLLYRRQTHI